MKKSAYDAAVFYWKKNNVCQGVVALHVDDFLFGGTQSFLEEVIDKLRTIFLIGSEESNSFKYLGLNISEEEDCITLSQKSYIKSLQEMKVDMNINKDTVLSTSQQSELRAMCGQLNWIATQSRPDISYDVCQLSTKLNSATGGD